MKLQAKEIIYTENEPGNFLFFIYRGEVEISALLPKENSGLE